jgi:hypothetical protein
MGLRYVEFLLVKYDAKNPFYAQVPNDYVVTASAVKPIRGRWTRL